jgi:hypothetical protein
MIVSSDVDVDIIEIYVPFFGGKTFGKGLLVSLNRILWWASVLGTLHFLIYRLISYSVLFFALRNPRTIEF